MRLKLNRSALGPLIAIAMVGLPATSFGQTATCRNTGSFDKWLAEFKKEAAAQMISATAINAASPFLTFEQRIINIDRGQKFFAQNFLDFSNKLIPAYRLQRGGQLIKKHADIFQRIDKDYGVQAQVIVAFWGLESDFGASQGKEQVLRSLATLAYDCRRPELFRPRLFDALRIIERGDLRPEEMIGSWAGELGQTQMMASEYYRSAVDYDGDGHRNLIKSVPDVLASTANFLVHQGWKRAPAMAAGSARAFQSALGAGRSVDPAPALAMGGLGRVARRRQAAGIRRDARVARAADGTLRAGLLGLRQFQGLH